MSYEILNCKNYSKDKPSLLFFDLMRRISDNRLYEMNFMLNMAQILSRDFNIYSFSLGKNKKSMQKILKKYGEDINFVLLDDKEFTFLTKRKSGFSTNEIGVKNTQMIIQSINRDLTQIQNIRGIFMRPVVLYTSNENNEWFDCIDSDKVDECNNIIEQINFDIERKRMYPHTMFMTKAIRILWDTIEHYEIQTDCPIYQFVIDPAHYDRYFQEKYEAKTYYFENDFRGNRKYYKFPIGELNYFINNEVEDIPKFEDKNGKFIWGGVALFHKGERMNDYMRFLNNFDYKNSLLHISSNNRIVCGKSEKVPQILLCHPLYEHVNDCIKNHKLNKGLIPNEEFENKLKDYKYTLVMRCLSQNDSLNFRIFYSLLYNMIPFIADNYDSDKLQIPEKFRKLLEVKNSDDIISKIEYFEEHMDETKELLEQLKTYYIPQNVSCDFYYEKFKNYYFKNLYEGERK